MKPEVFFTVIIIAQLFFSISITTLTYSAPDDMSEKITSIAGIVDVVNIKVTASKIQSSVSQQTSLPLLDLGALAFYSSNIILDLILNFAFAIPQMFTLIINALALLFNIDSVIMSYLTIFVFVAFAALYFIGLIKLISSMRTGQTVI